MKFIGYLVLGILCFLGVEFFSVNYATFVGAGFDDTGILTTSNSLLTTTVVISTTIIWHKLDALKK